MSDLIDRQAVLDALSNAVPSLTTPDGSGQFDRELQIVCEALVDAMQIVHALPAAQRWVRCEEPPKKNGSYAIGFVYQGVFFWSKGIFFNGKWHVAEGVPEPDYWMPIEPPKEVNGR